MGRRSFGHAWLLLMGMLILRGGAVPRRTGADRPPAPSNYAGLGALTAMRR